MQKGFLITNRITSRTPKTNFDLLIISCALSLVNFTNCFLHYFSVHYSARPTRIFDQIANNNMAQLRIRLPFFYQLTCFHSIQNQMMNIFRNFPFSLYSFTKSISIVLMRIYLLCSNMFANRVPFIVDAVDKCAVFVF